MIDDWEKHQFENEADAEEELEEDGKTLEEAEKKHFVGD